MRFTHRGLPSPTHSVTQDPHAPERLTARKLANQGTYPRTSKRTVGDYVLESIDKVHTCARLACYASLASTRVYNSPIRYMIKLKRTYSLLVPCRRAKYNVQRCLLTYAKRE